MQLRVGTAVVVSGMHASRTHLASVLRQDHSMCTESRPPVGEAVGPRAGMCAHAHVTVTQRLSTFWYK